MTAPSANGPVSGTPVSLRGGERERAARLGPGLAVAGGLAVLALGAARLSSPLSPLVLSLILGAVMANTVGVPAAARDGLDYAARAILRTAIAVLGLQLVMADLLALGAPTLLTVIAITATTFVTTCLLGRLLGVAPRVALLTAVGFSICGASAVAATAGVVHSEEEETAYAVGLVTIFGTLAVAALPVVGGLIGLPDGTFGLWVGASIHDVGQVVATASTRGGDALTAAVLIKLTRVAMLAPLLIGLAAAYDGRGASTHPRTRLVPPFIVLFFLASALRSADVLPESWVSAAKMITTALFTVALGALGTATDVKRLRWLGGRPLMLGLLSWVVIAVTALVAFGVVLR